MKWSWRIGSVAGIGIFVHWTFLLLIGWILFAHLAQGDGVLSAVEGVGFVLAIFACVVLHELGHALTARRFGYATRDITLLPIGGVARLERLPDQPLQEFLVAIAGPAVNVVIAAVLMVIVVLMRGFADVTNVKLVGGDFLTKLLVVNVGLAVFNLLPAFPMDGGRVLRAFLSSLFGHLRATEIAAAVGQAMAILFGLTGLMLGHGVLIFVALFIYMGAAQEAQAAHVNSILLGVPVREAMVTSFRTLAPHEPLDVAIQKLLSGDQQDFPVVEEDELVGMLRRDALLEALAAQRGPVQVAEVMQRDCDVVEDGALLQTVFEKMSDNTCSSLPVVRRGRLVGIVSLENIGEWLMIQSALRRARNP